MRPQARTAPFRGRRGRGRRAWRDPTRFPDRPPKNPQTRVRNPFSAHKALPRPSAVSGAQLQINLAGFALTMAHLENHRQPGEQKDPDGSPLFK